MGAAQSSTGRQKCRNFCPNSQVKRRIELLEELCLQQHGQRAELISQLATGSGCVDVETLQIANVLAHRPPEFQPGELIAAGSYGRVYAGTYGDQPAALKLLILDEETAHEILNEVRLCLKLNHKNLVQLLDCAVVASNKQAAAAGLTAPASPGPPFTGQHQVLPLFGTSSNSATPSAACPFNYLPVVSSSRGPFSSSNSATSHQATAEAASKDVGSLEVAELSPANSGRLPALSTTLGHACFEVWIAMELCDGGTLAEQLQRGFHCLPGSEQVDLEQLLEVGLDVARALSYMHRESVCHGDLKTENVLLKSLSDASTADMPMCSTCGSTCCHEDCNWLTFFCNSSVSSNSVASRYCRSCSGDSCWSCASRAAGCVMDGDSSSPDTCSTSSSNASGPNAVRRSRPGFKGSHLLSGLCCMGSPSSCATEDDLWEEEDERMPSGCFACGCGVMTLEPTVRSRFGPPAPHPQHLQQKQQQLGAQEHQQQVQSAPAGPDEGEPADVFLSSSNSLDAVSTAPVPPVGFGSSSMAQPLPYGGFSAWSHSLPPAINEGQEQQLFPPSGLCGVPELQEPSSTAAEEAPEEEHVAPLSLYTQARQRRRSRCLPLGVVLPAALAAAAAAAAANGHSDTTQGSATSSGGGSSSGGSDDEGTGPHKKALHARASAQLPQTLQRQGSLDDSILPSATAGRADAASAHLSAGSSAGGRLHQAESLGSLGSFGAAPPACHDVYAHSMMRPPVARRARRHSYCYGTAASYGASVFSFSRPGAGRAQPGAMSGISATEAAAAIAAAAEAVRHDSARTGAAERGSRRNRRMSWDDRMLRQQSPTRSGLSGLLGAALPALTRLSSDVAAVPLGMQQLQAAGGMPQGSRRTRRHSWAGYLQPDMSTAAAALGLGMQPPAGSADRLQVQAQMQQQQQPFRLPPSTCDSLYGASIARATGSGTLGPIPSSSRNAHRARRHSWAGYAGYGVEQGIGKLPPRLRALSSCFAADASMHSEGAGQTSLHSSPPRHMFSLPQFPGCCGENFLRPLDDPGDGDCSRHALLEGMPSSGLLVDSSMQDCLLLSGADAEGAASVGCFGRWCSSGTGSSLVSSVGSGSQQRSRRRRYSWCCGAGSEAELWADPTREESCSQMALLSGAAPLSVPLLPLPPKAQRKQRRDRRCSWDDFRYSGRLTQNWGRKAASLDAQASTPDSWRSNSQQLDISPPCEQVSRQSQLYRSSSDIASSQLAAAAAAVAPAASTLRMGAQSEGLPSVRPLSAGPGASGPSAQPPQAAQAAADVMQLITLSPNCSNASSPAAKQCSTPVAPIKPAAPCLPGAADTQQDVQVDQSLSGLDNICLTLPPHAGKTSRVRVSIDQPLSPRGPQQGPQSAQQQPSAVPGTSLAWVGACSSNAAAGAAVRQVTVADLLSLCAPAPAAPPPEAATAAAAGGAATAAAAAGSSARAAEGAKEGTAAEPFTGSFTLHPSGSRVGLVSDATATSAAGSAKGPGGRGRRWSTGVAATQLLMRKQLLDEHGCDVLEELGRTAGSNAAGSTQAPTDASTQPPMAAGCWQVAADDAGSELAPNVVPMLGNASSASSGVRRMSGLTSSNNISAAINVLGMPRQRPVVISQRRMSYDTATAAYQMVAQMDTQQLSEALNPSQQLAQEVLGQPWQVSPIAQVQAHQEASGSSSNAAGSAQGRQPAAGSTGVHAQVQGAGQTASLASEEEQMNQQCQAQMARLLEALAKKGYGGYAGMDADGTLASSSAHANAQAGTAQAAQGSSPPATASLQHQQQVAHDVTQVPQRRFCAKVCDFGFSKCLRAGQSHCSTASAGTITHQAPEVLRHGHLSPAADVYAFGIIMWELLTRDRPFKGLLEGDLVVGVCDRGLRPVFPPGCPASYVTLAQQCWSEDPSQRPTAAHLVKRLNELLYEERRAKLRASACVNGAHHNAQHCRRRRHSMPVAGGYHRQRRRSRRMSLFLLPFTRQPAVPEDAPLDQQSEDWRCTASGQHVRPVPIASRVSSLARKSTEQQQGASSPNRTRGSSHIQSGLNNVTSSGCHVVSSGGSSGGNAVASAGGLLASSSTLFRLKGAAAAAPPGSAPVLSVAHTGPASAAVQSGPAAAAGTAADGTEWFESF